MQEPRPASVALGDDLPAHRAVVAKTWSTRFPVHPAADVFPMMSDDELGELGEDIKANGLQSSIVLWQDNADTHLKSTAPYYLLDGRNRLAAMDRAGIPAPADWQGYRLDAVGPIVFARVCGWVWIKPVGKWEKTPGVDPAAFAIGANIRRRHLSKEQQADLIVKAVQAGLANLARNEPEPEPEPGRPKDPVKEKAVELGEKQGIGKRTIERSLARQDGRPRAPRALRAEAAPLPTLTYGQTLEANVERDLREIEQAEHALARWRERLAEDEALLRNYRAKHGEVVA